METTGRKFAITMASQPGERIVLTFISQKGLSSFARFATNQEMQIAAAREELPGETAVIMKTEVDDAKLPIRVVSTREDTGEVIVEATFIKEEVIHAQQSAELQYPIPCGLMNEKQRPVARGDADDHEALAHHTESWDMMKSELKRIMAPKS